MKTEIERRQNNSDRRRTLDEVFVENYNFLFRAAKGILKKVTDASDVVQALYLKCAEGNLSCNTMDSARAYLHRATVNLALDWKRSRKSKKEDDGVDELEIQDASTGRAMNNVRGILENLFSNCDLNIEVLQVLILRHVEGYTDTEIAEMLGETRSKIASMLSRAHKKLRNGDWDLPTKGQRLRPDLSAIFAACFGTGSPVLA